MCDVLLVGDESATTAWFSERVLSLPNAWERVSTIIEADIYVEKARPKAIIVSDQLNKQDIKKFIHRCASWTHVVVVGKYFDIDYFQLILEWGGEDYWVLPLDIAHIKGVIKKTRLAILAGEGAQNDQQNNDEMIIGKSQDMITAVRMASLVAKTNTTVLIRGESGTGKELLAREIHKLSGRTGPFVALNCAAISEGVAESELFGHERGAFTGAVAQRQGCFEQAHGGTLFLDEVGDASPSFQAKLLRVLERNEFTRVGGQQLIWSDVRVVAATNANLEGLIDSGSFRLDLHYRLGAVSINLPPLRDRCDDLPEIIGKMVGQLNGKLKRSVKGVSKQAVEQLLAYDWPGNLRELYQVLHRALLLCRRDVIACEHLQGVGDEKENEDLVHIPTLSELEETHIAHVLNITSGNKGRACDLLGISRPTLRRKLHQYAIHLEAVPA